MKIDSNDVAPIIGAIAALLTVVGGFVVQIVMMVRQNRKLEEHTLAIRKDIAEVHTGQTGVQKTLPGP